MDRAVKFNLTYDHVENVIVTALEGGSNYWYFVNHEDIPPGDGPASVRISKEIFNNPSFTLPVYDLENPDELLGEFKLSNILEHSAELAPWALSDLLSDNLDATGADALFQIGVMGEIIFG